MDFLRHVQESTLHLPDALSQRVVELIFASVHVTGHAVSGRSHELKSAILPVCEPCPFSNTNGRAFNTTVFDDPSCSVSPLV